MDLSPQIDLLASTAKIRPISQLLADLDRDLENKGNVDLSFLLEALHERGFGVVLILFALPAAIPAPPGINTVFALPLLLLTGQQALGLHKIWMPEKIRNTLVPADKLQGMIRKIIPWVKKLEILIKPRMGWVTWDGASRFFGFLGFLMALIACIPLPLTHTVPSIGIILMAFGTIMRDGLTTIIGAVVGMSWITLLAGIVTFFGPDALEAIRRILT